MRLSSIFLVAAATLLVCSDAASGPTHLKQTEFSTAKMAQSSDTATQKSTRFLRSTKTEDEERNYKNYPFLVSEEAAMEMAKRIIQQHDDALLAKVKEISNGQNILKRWRAEELTLADIMPLLKDADKWKGTSERLVYKLVRDSQFQHFRVPQQLDDVFLSNVRKVKNGEKILKQWTNEDYSLSQIKSLLEKTGKGEGTSERLVYKL
ncbi:hypothetical protein F443_10343, partial [Phytophthora nicotianae P1569]